MILHSISKFMHILLKMTPVTSKAIFGYSKPITVSCSLCTSIPQPDSQPGPGPAGLCMLCDPPGQQAGGGGGCLLSLEQCSIETFCEFYQCMPKSEVACPKKDSITASNWGRFLPVLQIKLPLKLFVLGGLCSHPPSTPPSLTNTQAPPHFTIKVVMLLAKSILLLLL